MVHTGNKVDRIGNKVEPIGNKVDRDKLSNSHCCRFVAKTGNKIERIGKKVEQPLTFLNVQLCCQFVAGSTKSTVLNSTLLPVFTRL